MKIDGKPISDFGLTLLRNHDHPMMPNTRNKTASVPNKHGAYDFGADLSPRTFELPLGWLEKDATELQKRIREFANFLTDNTGRPRTMKLEFDYEPDVYYMVRYSGSVSIQRLLGYGEFTLPLVAHDPFGYGSEVTIQTSPFGDNDSSFTSGTLDALQIV